MMRSVVTLFVFSNLVDIRRARPLENETETTPSPFDDELGFTTPSTDKDILLATTPSPSEGWQHTTATLETPEMAQHKFIDKYDLPDAVTKPDTVELEEIVPTKSIDEEKEEVKPIRTTQQSFTIAADDMKNEMTMASTQNQTETSPEKVTVHSPVTLQNEQVIENNPDTGEDTPDDVEELEALPVDENVDTEEVEEGAETEALADEVVPEDKIESYDQDINEKNEGDQLNEDVQNVENEVEIEPVAIEEQNSTEVQDENVDDSPQIEPELHVETEVNQEKVEDVIDNAPEIIIAPNEISEPVKAEDVENEEPNKEIEHQAFEVANQNSVIDMANVDNQGYIDEKPEDPENAEIVNNLEYVESDPDVSEEIHSKENLGFPVNAAEDVPEDVIETISNVNLDVLEIDEEPVEVKAENLYESDLVVAETGDTVDSPIAKSMMDDFAADLNGRLPVDNQQPSDPAGVVLPDDYEAKSPLSTIIAPDVPESPEKQAEAVFQVNNEPVAVLNEPEKDEEPIKSPVAVMIETPNISNEKLDAELDGFDKLNDKQQEAVLEFVKSKLAKEKEVLQEGLAEKVVESVIQNQIPAEPENEVAHIEENGRMEDDEEDDVIEKEIIEPISPEAESDELDKIIDNNAASPVELDTSLYEDDKDVHGVEYHYENNYNQAVGDGKALSWEGQAVEQIKPPSIFDHGEMKEEYYDSYHAQKNPDAYIDNNAYDLEDGSGEAGFENMIIETIVKDAETDHILDNERPRDRKLIVEDLIEQKKAEYHEEKYRELEREEFEESKRSSRGWLLTFGFFGVFFILITRRKVRRLMPSSLGTRAGGGSSIHGGGRGDKLVTISPERGYGKSSDDEF